MISPYILIIDYGSQLTQLVARRVRDLGFYSEVISFTAVEKHSSINLKSTKLSLVRGIILSGGPNTVGENTSPCLEDSLLRLNVPILGICYGMQILADKLGGTVSYGKNREFGKTLIRARGPSKLFRGIQDYTNDEGHGLMEVWMSHGDSVTKLPPEFKLIASSSDCEVAAIGNEEKNFYGLQFHPEASHTKKGSVILERFCKEVCNCEQSWNMKNYASLQIKKIKNEVSSDKVLLGLSGGVDSAVVAKILDEAVGSQLICIFVDTGLLRMNEASDVMSAFSGRLKGIVKKIDASKLFFNALKGITDPEGKRKIVGKLFIEIFEKEACNFDDVKWLAQGTIYPDVVESAGNIGSVAKKIKSHHNVGGLPDRLSLKLLEPLRDLFKDEVRRLGTTLGLEHQLVYRHPFPGPGLSIRILGEVTEERVNLLQHADQILINLLKNTAVDEKDIAQGLTSSVNLGKSWYDSTSQAFVVFLPVKSVGVQGDNRTYQWTIAVRVVETNDFMTANIARLPFTLVENISSEIINKVENINRVVFDISNKPPATIEWE